MIREVYVNGYRSLDAIKLPLRAGLNILVGPNGGGKTNILSFFEFLSRLSELPVDEAVSSHGGIGRVFCRIPDNNYRTTLDAQITGSVAYKTRGGFKRSLWYSWKFEIESSEDYDEIFYKRQKLYINSSHKPTKLEQSDLVLLVQDRDSGKSVKVERMIVSRLQNFFKSIDFMQSREYVTKLYAQRFFEYYTRYGDVSKNSILRAFPQPIQIFQSILRDIRGGEMFNIVPEVCKQPEDSARPPVIEKNGAGLASVLHRLGRQKVRPTRPSMYPLRFSITRQTRLDKIVSYIKLINPSIQSVNTINNPIDNTISVFINILEKDGSISFPLAQCSDGTVKWIALLTKVITASGGFSIEEPENFLHPLVQKEFLNVVRTEADSNDSSPYTLLTTHSESLLNEASPDELILVWMDKGRTIAKRVSNSDVLAKEINRTGFGLGYYYISGSIDGA